MLINYLDRFKLWDKTTQLRYLVKCCKNISITRYNKIKGHRAHVSSSDFNYNEENFEIADDSPSIEASFISLENQKRLVSLIGKMDAKYADVLFFNVFVEMSIGKIAKMMGLSENLVSVRLYRAKRILIETNGGELDDILRK